MVCGTTGGKFTLTATARQWSKLFLALHLILFLSWGSAIACQGWLNAAEFDPWQFALRPEKPEWLAPRVFFDSAHSFDAIHYDIFVDVPYTSGDFSGRLRLTAVAEQAGLNQIELHMMHLTADSVKNDSGFPLTYVRGDSTLTINLPVSYPQGDTFAVSVFYHDIAQQRGFYYYPRNSYTMAEPYDARWWFPCFDEPWDKATANISCRVPTGIDVASNGTLTAIDSSGGYSTFRYRVRQPITTYLICLGVGDYTTWVVDVPDGLGDSIPCTYFVYPEDSAAAAYDFATVPVMMAAFNNYFGPYPFDSYGMVAVQPFQYGGMEHQTMTTINRSWINGNRASEFGIAHELAHQWWGDLVTMSDFRHIWLNEGFATYAEALYAEYVRGRPAYDSRIQSYISTYFYYDEHVGRFPLFDPDYYFNLAEYVKGALVLHMLRGVVGEDHFFASLLHYADLYAYGNASTEDFRDAVEAVSGIDLDYFFQEWIYEQGYPEYDYSFQAYPDSLGWRLMVSIMQTQTNSTIFSMPIQLLVEGNSTDTLVTVFNTQQFETFRIDLPFEPTGLVFDPGNWIVKHARQESSVGGGGIMPELISLGRNYPNPFNGSTSFGVHIPETGETDLAVFDIGGRLTKSLFAGVLPPGNYSFSWDGTDDGGRPVASGIYLYRLRHEGRILTRRMSLIK